MPPPMPAESLSDPERLLYRDRLRAARYAALADSEGFTEVCFALEALGLRLHGAEGSLWEYKPYIAKLAKAAPSLSALPGDFPMFFTRFEALFNTVRRARNDAMHIGAYARHATAAAIELCIGLEEAVMNSPTALTQVADFMVKTPVSVEPWQPVAQARQLMLMHSFSFLPVLIDGWKLVSELEMARFLRSSENRSKALGLSIKDAAGAGLKLLAATTVHPSDEVSSVLARDANQSSASLWLVIESDNRLSGVLSPFELM